MKKCTDRKGVTILMALLLLLVASMVSVVILTAATTAARHISNDRQSQQTYLTVSSAAELLRDDILSSGYEQKVTRRPTATGSYIERTEVTQTPQGAMKAWLERGIEAVVVVTVVCPVSVLPPVTVVTCCFRSPLRVRVIRQLP